MAEAIAPFVIKGEPGKASALVHKGIKMFTLLISAGYFFVTLDAIAQSIVTAKSPIFMGS
ncbi:MAG: hypothetical protein MUF49_01750 [Oculatellaceae cyanobacterium Prado106]|jgi:hypothetical protein|nr:hypothetical protein [Oculatellaceae cyanobacterium Prado106]